MTCLCADPDCRMNGCKAARPQTGHDVFKPLPYKPHPWLEKPVDMSRRLDEDDIDKIANKVFDKMKEFFNGR